ncbi:SNARE-interacting protein KEULE isoform X7 [Physcomitrium patens]|uniref:SNARE-interacting protein KEULE isoform X7 n=1 Tax=Physcomitrium patens TaxID=3218 RepID=UPI000D159205|nr:SNARE-interacting protein KEULE-like isoform X8 [Physcomitrium patens]|eukprot:XP_024398650.1 SNARE-interacting protein KEULE-like isoform X8 [Physcomitrella patens]
MADLSSSRSVYRSFKQILHDRLLKDMLHTVRTTKQSTVWKVLVMDEITVKVMSSSCKMTEITEEGISLVENIGKSRQPLPALDAVYFIQPSQNNVESLIGDMSGKAPRYKRAFVFFSSPVPRNLLNTIKSEASVLARVAVLREVNVEFLTIDTQIMTKLWNIYLEIMARIHAIMNSVLKEFPHVRYRAPNPHAGGSDSKVAPIMHEWTYDAMCNDLLDIDGSKYTYEVTTSSGKKERKEVLLADNDPIWMEIRDLHIADASLQLTEKMQEFGKKNEAAQLRLNNKEGQEISTKEMQKLVQALPQFQDQIDKLSLHIHKRAQIATTINDQIKKDGLNDIGKLEQDLVYGEATSKDILSMIDSKQGMSQDNKLRLLLIYAATHPDKLDTAKRLQWTKLAKLSGEDMNTITNLECLGVSLSKKQPEGFSLQFRPRKVSIRPTRKEKNQDEMGWQLSRFYPLIEDVVAELGKNGLPKEQYPYVKLPVSLVGEASVTGQPASAVPLKKPHSVRTIRYNWAAAGKISVGSASSDSGSSTNEPTITGTRIFVFIVGGMTRSELRTMRKLTAQLKREVIIGSTSLDNPQQFLQKLRSLTTIDDID